MQNQWLIAGSTTPSLLVKFLATDTGAALTTLTHSTPGFTLAYQRDNAALVPITLAAQTVTGSYVSGGFCHIANGVYRLDPPVLMAAANAKEWLLTATALPANVSLVDFTGPILTDDPTLAGSSAPAVSTQILGDLAGNPGTAARTAIAGNVRTNLATELARIDANVSGAVTATVLNDAITLLRRALSVGARFGGPVAGGSQLVFPVYDAGNPAILLGSVTVFFDAAGKVTGQSELTPP